MALVNGATYRLQCRADSSRSLNVYGTTPTSLANVCLYKNNDDDICQQWVYKKSGSREYFVCKGNQNLALDLYTGSSSTANVKNYNAHVYAPSETSYVKIKEVSGGYIQIYLADTNYSNKYLTANQGSNGTSGGKDVNAAGNVYFYKGGLTDHSQDWKPIRLDGGSKPDPEPTPGKEVVVTGMPPCWAYTGNTEYFHPSSGMIAGDFNAKNNGKTILTKIKNFYEKAFKTTLSGDVDSKANMDKYGYSLYGSRTVTNDKFNGTYHLGVDMTLRRDAPVYSVHSGKLLYAKGNRIAIYDADEDVTYLYLHTDIDSSIKGRGSELGDPVNIKIGQPLGTQSDQGLSSGSDHLHFEVKDGKSSVAEMPTKDLDNTVFRLYRNPYEYM